MPSKRRMTALASALLAAMAFAPAKAADLGDNPSRYYRPVWALPPYNGVPVSLGYGLCYRQELHQTPWGPRWIMVNRCP